MIKWIFMEYKVSLILYKDYFAAAGLVIMYNVHLFTV